jgi:hypothetical protein
MKEVMILKYWEWFIKCFYSKKAIAYSRFRPITNTIGYVLLIVFIASIPYFVNFNVTSYKAIEKLNHLLSDDLPSFHLKNGELFLDSPEAFFTDELNEGFVLIDPSNQYTVEELEQLNEGIAFQQQNMHFVSNNQIQTLSYTLLGLNEFTKDELAKRIGDLKSFLPILLLIITALLYVGLAGLAYLGITLLAYVALIFKGRRASLQYRHLWSITAHSLTLPVIFLYWMDTLFVPIPFSAFIFSTLFIVFLAVKSIPVPK